MKGKMAQTPGQTLENQQIEQAEDLKSHFSDPSLYARTISPIEARTRAFFSDQISPSLLLLSAIAAFLSVIVAASSPIRPKLEGGTHSVDKGGNL